MNSHIAKTLYYIEKHLDGNLDVETLSRVAGYSPYHFCRIFKMSVGESAISYAARLRMERASLNVITSDKSIIEIALDAGFETPNGFNKAFKKIFEITPTEYRDRYGNLQKFYKERIMQTAKIVEREESYVVFGRELGAYEKSADSAWKKLSESLNNWGKDFKDDSVEITLDEKEAEYLGICYDDPSVTPAEKIRYEAAIAWDQKEIDFLSTQGFETKSIPGGKYAVATYKGDYQKSLDAWMGIYAWIEQQGYTFRDIPPFEKYIDAHENVSEEKQLTEIYIPIV